jgi:hypothetical protein
MHRQKLVTGGASGIGRATVNRLAPDGAHVVVADTQVELAANVVAEVKKAGGNAELCELDVSEEGAAAATVADIVTAHIEARLCGHLQLNFTTTDRPLTPQASRSTSKERSAGALRFAPRAHQQRPGSARSSQRISTCPDSVE